MSWREGWLRAVLLGWSCWSRLAEIELARCYGLQRRADLPGALPHVD